MTLTQYRGWATDIANIVSIDGDTILGTPPTKAERTYTLDSNTYYLEQVSLSEATSGGATKFTITLSSSSAAPAVDVFEKVISVGTLMRVAFFNKFVASAEVGEYFAVGDTDSATTPRLDRDTTGSVVESGTTYYFRNYVWDVDPFGGSAVLGEDFVFHISGGGKQAIEFS